MQELRENHSLPDLSNVVATENLTKDALAAVASREGDTMSFAQLIKKYTTTAAELEQTGKQSGDNLLVTEHCILELGKISLVYRMSQINPKSLIWRRRCQRNT